MPGLSCWDVTNSTLEDWETFPSWREVAKSGRLCLRQACLISNTVGLCYRKQSGQNMHESGCLEEDPDKLGHTTSCHRRLNWLIFLCFNVTLVSQKVRSKSHHNIAHIQSHLISLPSINFPQFTVSEIQSWQLRLLFLLPNLPTYPAGCNGWKQFIHNL